MENALVQRGVGDVTSDGSRLVTIRVANIPRDLAPPGTPLAVEGPDLRSETPEPVLVSPTSGFTTRVWYQGSNPSLSIRIVLDGNPDTTLWPGSTSTVASDSFCFPLDLISSPGEPITIDYDYEARIVDTWLTRGDQRGLLRLERTSLAVAGSNEPVTIQVDPATEYQVFEGMGAAMTESSAHVIAASQQRNEIMQLLFTRGGNGIGLSYLRVPLGSSDFSLDWYTYDDDGLGEDLSSFSIDRDRELLIPLLRQAKRLNPDLKVMGTPWSPPGWMKTGATGPRGLHGGQLRSDMHDTFARYLLRTMLAYRDEGIELATLSLQNEPLFGDADYPCMFMPVETQVDVIERLTRLMASHDLSTRILVYDHNWDRPDYPEEVFRRLSPDARNIVLGSAWHGYDGRPDSQSRVHELEPQMGIYFTEITGGSWDTEFSSILNWNMQNVVLGSIRNWSKSVMLWNLALDPSGGPSIRSDQEDVRLRGVLEIAEDSFSLSPEFYILGHVSKFVLSGARRVASSQGGGTRSLAFRNVDGSIVILAYNPSPDVPETVTVAVGPSRFESTVPPRSVASFVAHAPKR